MRGGGLGQVAVAGMEGTPRQPLNPNKPILHTGEKHGNRANKTTHNTVNKKKTKHISL
jgi:hypothetical protein